VHLRFQLCHPRGESTHIERLDARIAKCIANQAMPLVMVWLKLDIGHRREFRLKQPGNMFGTIGE